MYLKEIICQLFHLDRETSNGQYLSMHPLSMPSLLHRKPSLKLLSYSASLVDQPSLPSTPPVGQPIRVAKKGRCRRQIKNVFADDWGYPNQSDKYDTLHHNIDGGPVLKNCGTQLCLSTRSTPDSTSFLTTLFTVNASASSWISPILTMPSKPGSMTS